MVDLLITFFIILAIMFIVAFAGLIQKTFLPGLDCKYFQTFDARWPPITDDQFLQRCPPGTNQLVALKVRKIVAQQLGIPYDQVYPEQSFENDLLA